MTETDWCIHSCLLLRNQLTALVSHPFVSRRSRESIESFYLKWWIKHYHEASINNPCHVPLRRVPFFSFILLFFCFLRDFLILPQAHSDVVCLSNFGQLSGETGRAEWSKVGSEFEVGHEIYYLSEEIESE